MIPPAPGGWATTKSAAVPTGKGRTRPSRLHCLQRVEGEAGRELLPVLCLFLHRAHVASCRAWAGNPIGRAKHPQQREPLPPRPPEAGGRGWPRGVFLFPARRSFQPKQLAAGYGAGSVVLLCLGELVRTPKGRERDCCFLLWLQFPLICASSSFLPVPPAWAQPTPTQVCGTSLRPARSAARIPVSLLFPQ